MRPIARRRYRLLNAKTRLRARRQVWQQACSALPTRGRVWLMRLKIALFRVQTADRGAFNSGRCLPRVAL